LDDLLDLAIEIPYQWLSNSIHNRTLSRKS
jgi:hypothetical protein